MAMNNILKAVADFGVKKIPRKEGKGILNKITGREFTTGGKALMYGVGGAYVASGILSDTATISAVGEVRGESTANMTDQFTSPSLRKQLQEFSNGEQEQLTDEFNATTEPVSAEIVNALFELSGQGGI